MNRANVEAAIRVMERVRDKEYRFYMGSWQHHAGRTGTLQTEQAAHECGMACCFGGWLAVSPEWTEAGGRVDKVSGSPVWPESTGRPLFGSQAVAEFFEISQEEAEVLTATHTALENDDEAGYAKPITEITAQDVIDKLIELRDTGHVSGVVYHYADDDDAPGEDYADEDR